MEKQQCTRCGLPQSEWSEGRWQEPLCKVGGTTYETHVLETTHQQTHKSDQEIVESLLPRTLCKSGCDGHGTYPVGDGKGGCDPAPCQWCHEVVMPLREKMTSALSQARQQERERVLEQVREIHTLLHNGNNEEAYKELCNLLLTNPNITV